MRIKNTAQLSIKEIKELTSKLEEHQNTKHCMLHMCPDGQLAFSNIANYPILVASNSWLDILGYTSSELEGKSLYDIVGTSYHSLLEKHITHLEGSKKSSELLSTQCVHKDGTGVNVEWNISRPQKNRCYAVGRVVKNG